MEKHISTPIQYTVFNEVSVVHNTKISYGDFVKTIPQFLKAANLSESETNLPVAIVREALAQYLFPRVEIDPVKPGDAHLYNAEYEHKKEVFGLKAVKDFIFRDMKKTGKKTYTLDEMRPWFEPSEAPSQKDLKQPQVPKK